VPVRDYLYSITANGRDSVSAPDSETDHTGRASEGPGAGVLFTGKLTIIALSDIVLWRV